ncbi:DMT family transporter [Sphingosinicella rhizophila]|uniref:DMT family transporter n=1 Tax=Sphingosinicella rhizophila TaxID=3050082 RepID=A0ABU3Q7X1_9SPHN|nr:DMT family transporter [Sphingosinicella sp. GR2756]MDT9599512.1 DMT family transporter [Sphingosinicella sp. GR2756]
MIHLRPEAPARTGRFAFTALIGSNLLLAFGPWMVRLADVGPVAAGFWRLAIAAPFLLILAVRAGKGRPLPSVALLGMVVLGALFFAADLAAWHAGIRMTKLANAALFGNCSSFLFPIYGFLIARELPRASQSLALLLAGFGTFLLLGSSYELSGEHLLGDILALLGGIFYFFYLVAIDRARRTMAPMPVLALATIAGTVPLLLFALALGEKIMPTQWTPLILLSLGSQVLGQGLLVYAIAYLRPIVVGIALLIQPVANAMIGWIGYGEAMSGVDIAGALMICVALVLIRLRQPGASPVPAS